MKRKVQTGLCIIARIAISIAVLWTVVFYIRGGEIKKDIFNQFSYVVFEDHVELMKYYGNKKEVNIPKTLWGRPVTVIRKHCFHRMGGNDSLEEVTIPDRVEEIGIMAFAGCIRLEKINGGKNVKIIGDAAFFDCKELQTIGQLGESTEQIFAQAFYGCKVLKEFPFCDEIGVIECYAFKDTGLEEVKLPEKELFLGIGAFDETPWMEKQTDKFVVLNDVLIRYQGTEEVVHIPEGIRGVAYDFDENEVVREVYVPATAEYIAGDIYIDDNVEKIYIPQEVTKIGGNIYYDCDYDERNRYTRRVAEQVLPIWDKEKITIITTSGSPAEAYAKEFGYQYEIVEGW